MELSLENARKRLSVIRTVLTKRLNSIEQSIDVDDFDTLTANLSVIEITNREIERY